MDDATASAASALTSSQTSALAGRHAMKPEKHAARQVLLRLSPAWKMFVLGLLIALAAPPASPASQDNWFWRTQTG